MQAPSSRVVQGISLSIALCLLSLTACPSPHSSADAGQPTDGGRLPDGGCANQLTITGAGTIPLTIGGSNAPTLTLSSSVCGTPTPALWSVDRTELASITGTSAAAASVTLTPTAVGGGWVKVTAKFDGGSTTSQVLLQLTGSQNGYHASSPAEEAQVPTNVSELKAGGGVGGVGGEGLGAALADGGTLQALASPTDNGSPQGLTLLYPYDGTVWPLGLAAPLVMWQWTPNDAEGVKLTLSTASGSFQWTGTFGRPAILTQTGGAFVRHPIPQDIWQLATVSASGRTEAGGADSLTLGVTVAKDAQGHGPQKVTWRVAPRALPGVIYYSAYNTGLVSNSPGAISGGNFGAAVLGMRPGDSSPRVVAGASGSTSGCRSCHSVAAQGNRLVAQHGDNFATSSLYDLGNAGAAESQLVRGTTYPGLLANGTAALSPTQGLLALPDDSATPVTGGLSAISDLGAPSFDFGGTRVVLNPVAGSSVTQPGQQLWTLPFNAASTPPFGSPTLIADESSTSNHLGWPSFLPGAKSIVFEEQVEQGFDGGTGDLHSWLGAKADIAWTSAADATHLTALKALNGLTATGTSYLPKLAQPVSLTCNAESHAVGGLNADHADDAHVNYQPSAGPIPAGGYVWIAFVSRRMYGNEIETPSFCSDPRGVNLQANLAPKKLWVAAVDLNAAPGTDASHPAFYLPAQELLGVHGRPQWTLPACLSDGASCATGTQCCNGYCDATAAGGAQVCSAHAGPSGCSNVEETCQSAADCCDSADACVNGYCTQAAPQ